MTDSEKLLIEVLRLSIEKGADKNSIATFLQSYIQQNGFLSDEAGNIVKGLLKELQ